MPSLAPQHSLWDRRTMSRLARDKASHTGTHDTHACIHSAHTHLQTHTTHTHAHARTQHTRTHMLVEGSSRGWPVVYSTHSAGPHTHTTHAHAHAQIHTIHVHTCWWEAPAEAGLLQTAHSVRAHTHPLTRRHTQHTAHTCWWEAQAEARNTVNSTHLALDSFSSRVRPGSTCWLRTHPGLMACSSCSSTCRREHARAQEVTSLAAKAMWPWNEGWWWCSKGSGSTSYGICTGRKVRSAAQQQSAQA